MNYVIDACALIAFLNDEAGADTVTELLTRAETGIDRLFMSGIQVLEVYYDRIYIKGSGYADAFLESLYTSPIVVLSEIPHDVIREAGRLKTTYSISLADSIACATALCMNFPLVTSDHAELAVIERQEPIQFYWFR